MMGMTVVWRQEGVSNMQRKQISEVLTETMYDIGDDWHENYIPGKFTPKGARIYHYAKRFTKEITTGKVKQTRTGRDRAPDGDPLTWSGRSKQLATLRQLKPKRDSVTIVMPVKAFNFTIRKNPKINMRKEATTILPKELRQIGQRQRGPLEQRMRTLNNRATIRIT